MSEVRKSCANCANRAYAGKESICDYIGRHNRRRPCLAKDGCECWERTGAGAGSQPDRKIDEQHDLAMKLYESGQSDTQIASTLGISANAVSGWRKRNGLPIQRNRINEEAAMQLYNQGLSDSQIGARLGFCSNAIYRWRRRNGLPCNRKRR